MKGLVVISTAALLLMGSSAEAAGALLYSSIPDLTAAPAVNGIATTPNKFSIFQSFTLTAPAFVSSAEFDVTSNFGVSAGPDPFAQFSYAILADDAGLPGAEIFAEGVGVSTPGFSAVPTANGTTIVTAPSLIRFDGLAPGTYWVALADLQPMEIPTFSGGQGDLLVLSSSTGLQRQSGTMGFALFGGTTGGVPEPATWAMLLLGFGGVGAALRAGRSATRALDEPW
jgi:hypothetical protein